MWEAHGHPNSAPPGIPGPLLALPWPLTGCVCRCGKSPREGRDFPFPHCSTQIFFS